MVVVNTSTPNPPGEVVSRVPSPGEQHEPPVIVSVTTYAPTSFTSASSPQASASLVFSSQESESSDKLSPQSSRVFTAPLPSDSSTTMQPSTESTMAANQTSQAHPPGGSRLLALGSRNPQNAVASSMRSISSQNPASSVQKNGNVGMNAVIGAGLSVSQSIDPSAHFTPVVETLRPNNEYSPYEAHKDALAPPNTRTPETTHRGPLTLAGDRTVFPPDHILPTEAGLGGGFSNGLHAQSFEPASSGIAAAKGSRFAKFFDGKNRDSQPTPFSKGTSGLSQPAPQKPDLSGLHPSHNSEARAMEDIFAMLNNSAQVC